MKILVLSPWGLHGGYSGPLTLLDRLMRAVADRGATVDVAYRRRTVDRDPDWLTEGHPLLTSDTLGRAEQATWIAKAADFLRQHGAAYDVVHLHGGYVTNTAPRLALRRAARPTTVVLPVLEGGDLGLPPSGLTRVAKQQTVRLAGRCDVGLALSEGIAGELRSAGIATDNVIRIFNPVPADVPWPTAPRPLADGQVRLGFVGRLTETKRPHVVIETVARLRDHGLDASAVLIGPPGYDPAYDQRLRRLPEELGVDKWVELTGMRTDAVSLLDQQADVFVLPSSAEGLPGALTEALACGLPAVVTDVGAMAAVAAESGAAVVTDGSPADVTTRVRDLLDPHVFAERSGNAVAYARTHLSPASVADAYLSAITSAKDPK